MQFLLMSRTILPIRPYDVCGTFAICVCVLSVVYVCNCDVAVAGAVFTKILHKIDERHINADKLFPLPVQFLFGNTSSYGFGYQRGHEERLSGGGGGWGELPNLPSILIHCAPITHLFFQSHSVWALQCTHNSHSSTIVAFKLCV